MLYTTLFRGFSASDVLFILKKKYKMVRNNREDFY